MSLRNVTLYATGGGNFVTYWDLAYVDIITVKRNGQREYPVEELPTGTEKNFYYEESEGRIYFSLDRLFNSTVFDDNGRLVPELIHVIYKERT